MIHQNKYKTVKAFCEATDGNIAMIMGIMIVPLIIAVGAALDYSKLTADVQKAQYAADSAALAAATKYNESFYRFGARAAGNKLALINQGVSGNHKGLSVTIDGYTTETKISPTQDGGYMFEAIIYGRTRHNFMGIVGKHETEWKTVAYSEVGKAPELEVILVLDVSASMLQNNKIGRLKTAVTQFITNLNPYVKGDSYISVTLLPFSENINFGTQASNWIDPKAGLDYASSFVGCFRYEDEFAQSGDLKAYQPATAPGNKVTCPSDNSQSVLYSTNGEDLITQVNKMDTSWGTNTPLALLWAERFLNNQWRQDASFSPNSPKYVTTETDKIIVLLTDGEISITDTDQNGEIDSKQNPKPSDMNFVKDTALQAFGKRCDSLSQIPNLDIYSIGFNVADGETSEALSSCVAGKGLYYDAELNDLNSIFADISAVLLPVRIVK